MSTPTPRTNAAWNATFDSEQMSAGRTARTLREHSQQLETELAALTAERDQLRAEVIAAQSERELATERGRLDWLESPAGVDWQWSSSALTIRRAVIDAAMKEDAK